MEQGFLQSTGIGFVFWNKEHKLTAIGADAYLIVSGGHIGAWWCRGCRMLVARTDEKKTEMEYPKMDSTIENPFLTKKDE